MAENKSYSEKLKHPLWQKKRLEIMKRDKFKCKICKDKETTLAVHHLKYEGNPWDVDNLFLITVCEHCHEEIEILKKENKDSFDISKLSNLSDSNQFIIGITSLLSPTVSIAKVYHILNKFESNLG
jgi:hypothetical protein